MVKSISDGNTTPTTKYNPTEHKKKGMESNVCSMPNESKYCYLYYSLFSDYKILKINSEEWIDIRSIKGN